MHVRLRIRLFFHCFVWSGLPVFPWIWMSFSLLSVLSHLPAPLLTYLDIIFPVFSLAHIFICQRIIIFFPVFSHPSPSCFYVNLHNSSSASLSLVFQYIFFLMFYVIIIIWNIIVFVCISLSLCSAFTYLFIGFWISLISDPFSLILPFTNFYIFHLCCIVLILISTHLYFSALCFPICYIYSSCICCLPENFLFGYVAAKSSVFFDWFSLSICVPMIPSSLPSE